MNKRVMDSLVLKDEDFVFNGDPYYQGCCRLNECKPHCFR